MLCALSFLTISAYPHHRNTREAPSPVADFKANQAHDKSQLSKNMDTSYKSHMDSSSLYSSENEAKHPVVAEVQHKLSLESERLRVRLHQELAELREKLSPFPAHVSPTLTSLRERLAPLTQQLQSSLSSSTHELCVQVRLYLQSMETPQPQAEDSQALQQKALQWIRQTLDHSNSKMAEVIGHFHSEAGKVMGQFKDSSAEGEMDQSEIWQRVSSKLAEEVGVLQVDAQSRVKMLMEELASLQMFTQDYESKMSSKMERFCLNADLQNQLFGARMERLVVELQDELSVHAGSRQSFSSPSQQTGSLQEDFSLKLSSLIQDIAHSVQ